MDKILHKELSYKFNGLLYETHKVLGKYRNEKQYADYFEELLKREKLKYEREFRFEDIQYGQNKVRCVCDFIIEGKIILEFKAKSVITKEEYCQIKRYLVTLNLEIGILINFRQPRLVPKRILNSSFFQSKN